MSEWKIGKCHVCGWDGDQYGTSMHQCWSDRTLLEKIAFAVGACRASWSCGRCGGSAPPLARWVIEGQDVCSRCAIVTLPVDQLREQHYREALESAAKMLERIAGDDVSVTGPAYRSSAVLVRSHKVTP